MTTPDRDELWRRNQLARAILNHRNPNRTTVTLALAALDGTPIDILVRYPNDICPDWTTPSNTQAVIRGG